MSGYVYALHSYLITCGLLSLVGNVFTIYACSKYRVLTVFSGNRGHVILAGYLALADGIYSLTMLASLIFYWSDNKGVAAVLIGNFRQVPYRMNTFIILMISGHRLWLTLNPFRGQVSGRKTHIIVGLAALALLLFTGVTKKLKPISPCFTFLNCSRDPNRLVCGEDIFTSNKSNVLGPDDGHFEAHEITKLLIAPLIGVVVFTAIIIINLVLWQVSVFARRQLNLSQARESKQRFRGVITTVAVAGLYVVSLTPAFLNNVSKASCLVRSNPSEYTGIESFYFVTDLVEEWLYTVSTVGNPLLYAYINTTYRRFMKAQIMKVWRMVTCADSHTRMSAASFSHSFSISVHQRVVTINSTNQLKTVPQDNLEDTHNETAVPKDNSEDANNETALIDQVTTV